MSTMAESGVPPPTSDASDTADVEIPTNLPSDCGMDYIPLATMLATGQLAEADQVWKAFYWSVPCQKANLNRWPYSLSQHSLLVMPWLSSLGQKLRNETLSISLMWKTFQALISQRWKDCGTSFLVESLAIRCRRYGNAEE
jgi:hypothetical protein